jgi:phosphatidylinositol alpha-mannosyltransferase
VRVAIVCPYHLERPGGVQGQVLGLARALGEAGARVVVHAPAGSRAIRASGRRQLTSPSGLRETVAVTAMEGSRPAAHEHRKGCVAFELVGTAVGMPANGSVAPVVLWPGAWRRGLARLLEHRPDVVHVHEPAAPGLGWACVAARRVDVATFHRAGASLPYRVVGRVVARGLVTARLVAVSDAARRTAAAALDIEPAAFEVVPNAVDPEHFERASPAPRGEAPVVLFVGRHERRKGLGVLLDAHARLRARRRAAGLPEPVLWVAGSGPDTEVLRQAATRRGAGGVVWLGPLDHEQLAQCMRAADVVALPSLGGESYGVVLLEAMAAGALVVASDLPGYREAAAGHARFVPPGDPEALAAGIEHALDERMHARGLGSPLALARAKVHARRRSFEVQARRYLRLYEEQIARRAAR